MIHGRPLGVACGVYGYLIRPTADVRFAVAATTRYRHAFLRVVSGPVRAGSACGRNVPVRRMPIAGTTAARSTVSITKACKLADVSRRTIYNWIAKGKVEYVRTAGGAVRIFVDTLWQKPNDGAMSR